MYLYFDRKGTLLEMVNDEALRRYNKNINYVYVYMENEEDHNEFVDGLSYLTYHFKKPDGKLTIEYSTETHEGDEKLYGDENGVIIPVDIKRDLKHFRYGVKYAMHKIRIPSGDEIVEDKNGNGIIDEEEQGVVFEDNVFELAGPVEMSIRAHFLDGSIYTLGKVVFTIEHAVIKTTQGITLSQFDYLLKRVNEVEKMEVVGPEGPQGEAAGFGEPTANVTTLEPTEQATVSITTEGPNTQKVFNFDFNIPRGKEGLSVYIYDGILTETTTTITDKTQILLPSGRTLHEGDILLSSLEGYVGAMAKIESVTENEVVVDYIGVLEVQTEGGGITDVQVNGESVVEEGVANIPEASGTQAGVVTTGSQTFVGDKTFKGTIRIYSSSTSTTSAPIKCYKNGSVGFQTEIGVGGLSTSSPNVVPRSKLNEEAYLELYGYSASPRVGVAKTGVNSGRTNIIYFPLITTPSTFMVAPSTWSTGTSGSATLPEAGLYDIKTDYDTYKPSFIVNWDGTNAIRSSVVVAGTSGSLSDASALGVLLEISDTGVITLKTCVLRTGLTVATTDTINISFRKIGIA